MTISKLISAAVLAFAAFILTAGPAQAQTVNQRLHRQHARIAAGLHNHNLNRRQARVLGRSDKRIHRQERVDRMRDHGRLTGVQRTRLQHRLNRNSGRIFRAKHGGKIN